MHRPLEVVCLLRTLRRTATAAAIAASALPAVLQAQAPGSELPSLDSLLNIRISAAARFEQTTREAPASASIITRQDIERYGYQSVGEALASIPGFYLTNDLSYVYLGVRGFGRPSDNNNRIMLLVDGERLNDIFNGEAAVGQVLGIPIEGVERLEVVRGPGSTLYGSNAMLAVVNLITRKQGGGASVAVTAAAGEDEFRGTAVFDAPIGGGVALSGHAVYADRDHGDLYFPEFDSPLTNGGRLEGADNFKMSAASLRLEGGALSLTLTADETDQLDPTAPYQSSFGLNQTVRNTTTQRARLRYHDQLTARVGFEAHTYLHRTTIDQTVGYDEPFPDRIVDLDGIQWGGEVLATIDPRPGHRLVLGVEYRRVDPEIRVGSTLGVNASGEPIDVSSVYVLDELQLLPRLSLVTGFRADWYSTVGSALSPRGALVFHPGESSSIKLLYGEAFRAPTPLEQFIDEPPILTANPNLDPERIRTVEVVWEQRITEGLQSSLTAYDYRMRDLISQAMAPEGQGLTYMNLDEVRGRGMAAELVARLDRVSAFANASFQDAEQQFEAGNGAAEAPRALSNSPKLLLRAGAGTSLPWGGSVAGTLAHDASRMTARGGDTDAFTILNLNLQLPTFGAFRMDVAVLNALGAEYRHPAGLEHRQESMPQPGRCIRFTFVGSF